MPSKVKPIKIETSEGGVLKVIGRGKDACINFHTGRNLAFALIDNSPELREFFRSAAERLWVPSDCFTCDDQKTVVRSTGNVQHPLKVIACPDCTPEGTTVKRAVAMRAADKR